MFNYQRGILCADGVPLPTIATAVATPTYVYTERTIAGNWRAFDTVFGQHPHRVCYAVKANSNLSVLQTLAQLGSGFDIVSGGELARVLRAGGDPKRIVFSGVGKQDDEITAALRAGIHCFNAESPAEIQSLNRIAGHIGVKAPIALRINPDISIDTHPYIATGMRDSKFGIAKGDVPALYHEMQAMPHLTIRGIACHIGSQLLSLTPLQAAYRQILQLAIDLRASGITIEHIDMGGGLGVRYQEELPPAIADYAKVFCEKTPPDLAIHCEPGRAIVAEAGILLTRVIALKNNGTKRFCVVDAAMNDLLRPALYQAWHNILPVQEYASPTDLLNYDVVGPVCESGDFLGKDRRLSAAPGDLLAICTAGAYGFALSSQYNARPRAAEVMANANEWRVIRKRETYADLWMKEVIE